MLQIGVEIYGEELLAKAIKGVSERTANLAPFFEQQAAPIIYTATKQSFAKEGPGWTPLARSTMVQRSVLGFPPAHKILERTGKLRKSVTERYNPYNKLKIGRLEMQMYSNLKTKGGHYLAEIHQKGAEFDRPAMSKMNGYFHFFTASGAEVFTRTIAAAHIKIPARIEYKLIQQEWDEITRGMAAFIYGKRDGE